MQDWSWYTLEVTKLVQLRGRVPGIIAVILMLLTLGFLPWLVAKGNSSRKSGLIQVCVIVVAISAMSTIGWYVLDKVWRPIPDYIGIEAFGLFTSGLSGIVVLVVVAFSKKPRRIIAGLLVCSLSVLDAYAVPNIHYGTYANLVRVLRGLGKVQAFGEVDGLASVANVYHPGDSESAEQTPLEQRWRPHQAENIGTNSSVLVQVDTPATNFSP